MANYYTKFSVICTLPPAAYPYAERIHVAASKACFGDDIPEDFPEDLKPHVDGWTFELDTEDGELWLHSDDGGIDAVCAFIQHLLHRFDPQGVVELEWSGDCDKPRTDAYGGGAAIITATEIKSISTVQWLSENRPTPVAQASQPAGSGDVPVASPKP